MDALRLQFNGYGFFDINLFVADLSLLSIASSICYKICELQLQFLCVVMEILLSVVAPQKKAPCKYVISYLSSNVVNIFGDGLFL